jgi:hypothetical protein
MFAKSVLAVCLLGFSCLVFAQDEDPEKKRLETELAVAQAKADLLALKYPKFEGGNDGKVEGAEKLASMASQHLPSSTSAIGVAIAEVLAKPLPKGDPNSKGAATCSAGTIVLSGSTMTERASKAMSFARQIDALRKDIDGAKGRVHTSAAVAAAVPVLTALASYIGMTRTDYSIADAELEVDWDWLIASIVATNPAKLESERFPDGNTVKALVATLDSLQRDAAALNAPDEKKEELVARAEALRKALYTPGDDGILPLVSTALFVSIASDEEYIAYRKCLAVITRAEASPMLLTKQSAFSKGGKAYLYFPVQVSAIQVNESGIPVRGICKYTVMSTSIKLSQLTKENPDDAPWSKKGTPQALDCGSWPSPPPQNQGAEKQAQAQLPKALMRVRGSCPLAPATANGSVGPGDRLC